MGTSVDTLKGVCVSTHVWLVLVLNLDSCLHSVWGFFVSTYLLYYYTEVILLIHIKYILCVQGHHVYSMVAFMSIFEPSSKVLADFFICFIESQMIVNFK